MIARVLRMGCLTMWVERRVNVKGRTYGPPSLAGVPEHLAPVGPMTVESGPGDLFGLFPHVSANVKTVVHWSHRHEFEADSPSEYIVSVTSGTGADADGVRNARSKVIVSASNPHGSISYVLTPEAYADHPPAVAFSRLSDGEQAALRLILEHVVLSNRHFSTLTPSDILGEKRSQARAAQWTSHVEAESVRVKQWLQDALRSR